MRRRLPRVLLLVLLAAPAVSDAATRWQRAQVVSAPGAFNPFVRMDSRGRALVLWHQFRAGQSGAELRYAWRAPRERFARPRVLGVGSMPGGFPEHAFALAPNGIATAAYLDPEGRVAVHRARPGRPFRLPRAIGEPGVQKSPPVVATDDEGRAVVAWGEARGQDDLRIMAAFVDAGGAISTPGLVGAGQVPSVAMNPAGAAVIAWGDTSGRPYASVRPPAGEFGPPSMPPVQGPAMPRAAIDARGRAVVVGTEFLPSGSRDAETTFSVAGPDGVFGARQSLGTGGNVEQLLAEPGGAVDFAGYRPGGDREGGTIMFAAHEPDGTVVGPTELSGPGACGPQLSVARRGDLMAAWTGRCTGATLGTLSRATVRVRRRGGRFGAASAVGAPGAHSTKGAITDGDEAVVVYTHGPTQSVHAVVREDRGDDPLPPIPQVDLDLPAGIDLPDVGSIELPVTCRRACALQPTGLLHAGETTVEAVRGVVERLQGKVEEIVAVPFPPEARAAAEEAVRTGESVWVSLTFVVRGASPRPQTITRRVELRPG